MELVDAPDRTRTVFDRKRARGPGGGGRCRRRASVLAMAGGASPPWAASTIATLASALPHASQRIVEGQQHIPADPVVAAILSGFLR